MARVFVSGLINLETTLAIDGFPLEYFPVRYPFFGIETTVSGVGLNIASALTRLGNNVDFASLIGGDDNGLLARRELKRLGIHDRLVLDKTKATAQSVIVYDREGRRQIHTDLKEIQNQRFPVDAAEDALRECDLAVICNINFARPLLRLAQDAGKPIATDVHALAEFDDPYNQDYMAAAQILFLSDEALPVSPEAAAKTLMHRFGPEIVVIGMGREGALLATRQDGNIERLPAVHTRPVVNTIGAGDALFSAFIDRYLRDGNPHQALCEAMVFASYKVGEKGAASGFLTGEELDAWVKRLGETGEMG